MLHLNNAGASIVSDNTHRVIVGHMELERAIGPYEAANREGDAIAQVKVSIGRLLGVDAARVAINDSATRSWNSVVYGLALEPGDVVVTSQLEFGSMLASLADICRRAGAAIRIAPTDNSGRVDASALGAILSPEVKLVALTHAPAHLPLLNPIEAIDKLTASSNIPLLVDACQTVGLLELPKLNTLRNAVCGTGRKWLRGPRGTGFVAVSEAWASELRPPTIDLANSNVEDFDAEYLAGLEIVTDGRRFEVWERSIANVLGLGRAVLDAAGYGLDRIQTEAIANAMWLKGRLRPDLHARLVCPEQQQTPVICLRLEPDEAKSMGEFLGGRGLTHSIMSAWDGPIDFRRRGLTKILRLSPHYFTPSADLEAAVSTLAQAPSLRI